jgi:HlyD family secretion protein
MAFQSVIRRPRAVSILGPVSIAAMLTMSAVTACRRDPAPPARDPGSVAALGRLQPEGDIVSVGGPPGSRLARFESGVSEGAQVNEGDVLAYLDSYAEAVAAREHAASELADAEQRRRAEERSGQASIDEANLSIRRANTALQLKSDAQDAELRRSNAELERVRLELQRAEKLKAADAILPAQYEAAALAAKQAEEVVARNRATLAELKEEREIQLQRAQSGLRAAEASRVRAELSARVQTLTQSLKLAEARVDLTRIRAPIGGEILQIVTHPGEALGPAPILRMGNTGSMFAIAEVYETDVPLVRVGQKATITSRALGEPITGRVERIGALIHKGDVLGIDPTADTDARVIEVRIRLDASPIAARFNQHQVDVVIDTSGTATAPAPGGTAPPAQGR